MHFDPYYGDFLQKVLAEVAHGLLNLYENRGPHNVSLFRGCFAANVYRYG